MKPLAFEAIEFGAELPELQPDTSLKNVRLFAQTMNMKAARFNDHEGARAEGLPGAIVPGIMSQGILAAMIHRWAPGARILRIDTIFRAPLLVDHAARCHGVVTDIDTARRRVEVDLGIVDEADESRVLGTATVEF